MGDTTEQQVLAQTLALIQTQLQSISERLTRVEQQPGQEPVRGAPHVQRQEDEEEMPDLEENPPIRNNQPRQDTRPNP